MNIAATPTPARERGKVAPAKMAHFVVRTNKYQEMVDWYATFFEAEQTHSTPFMTFLAYDEEHHRIGIMHVPNLVERPEDRLVGFDHVLFTYGNLGDLIHTYERLKNAGITPEACQNHGPSTSMYFLDPDRNKIEINVDNYEIGPEMEAWFATGAWNRNTVGVEFDPDELAARYHAGEPEDQLKARNEDLPPADMRKFPITFDGAFHASR